MGHPAYCGFGEILARVRFPPPVACGPRTIYCHWSVSASGRRAQKGVTLAGTAWLGYDEEHFRTYLELEERLLARAFEFPDDLLEDLFRFISLAHGRIQVVLSCEQSRREASGSPPAGPPAPPSSARAA